MDIKSIWLSYIVYEISLTNLEFYESYLEFTTFTNEYYLLSSKVIANKYKIYGLNKMKNTGNSVSF